jgi:hypothetical protein
VVILLVSSSIAIPEDEKASGAIHRIVAMFPDSKAEGPHLFNENFLTKNVAAILLAIERQRFTAKVIDLQPCD